MLWLDANLKTVWRSDNQGKSWSPVDNVPKEALGLIQHPFDDNKAFILGDKTMHWKTDDKGATWSKFDTPLAPVFDPLRFHAERPDYVIFMGQQCDSGTCHQKDSFYTLDNFGSVQKLKANIGHCQWTVSSEHFKNAPTKDIMCIEKFDGANGHDTLRNTRLVQSDSFFESGVQRINFSQDKEITGIIDIRTINKFIVAAARNPDSNEELDLYISKDGVSWHEAVFPKGQKMIERSYTLLESNDHSLMVNVLADPIALHGDLYKSNSNGTFFAKSLENVNRNFEGFVDFERIQGLEGIILANIQASPSGMLSGKDKDIQSRISFDDGKSWNALTKVKKEDGQDFSSCDNCALHLHSVTTSQITGVVYSSHTAVGYIMGVGHYGEHLLPYNECDTFLSTDGGLTWRMVAEGAHQYEFGDMGNLLVLVGDEQTADSVRWSKDRGQTWNDLKLDVTIRAHILTTDPESTSRKFNLFASESKSGSQPTYHAIQLDFTNVNPRKCVLTEGDDEKSDFERWAARDLTPGADCLMGHEQIFYRRKQDRDCYLGMEFKDPKLDDKPCKCTPADYECDYNFVRNSEGECTRQGPDPITGNLCKSESDLYPGSSGYRRIPGNTCEVADGETPLDEPVDRKCGDNKAGDYDQSIGSPVKSYGPADPGDERIKYSSYFFQHEIEQFVYFRKSPAVLVRLQNGDLFRTGDAGANWRRVLDDAERVSSFVMHEFDDDRAYAFVGKTMYYTKDQGEHWDEIKTPLPVSRVVVQPLDFHPGEKDWLLLICDDPSTIHTVAYISRDHGDNWEQIQDVKSVQKCIFGRDSNFKIEKNTIYCSAHKLNSGDRNNPLQLFRTTDWGEHKEYLFENVVEFFVVEDFMAVATDNKGSLQLFVSVDGSNFAPAQFPPDHYIDRNTFTVLQSTTHSILLNVFKSTISGKEYGDLYKSNGNGTFYHVALPNTNGDSLGFVDFEKMQSVDGIIFANQVMNTNELRGSSDVQKKVRTMVTWDDGSTWLPLQPPHNYDCSGKDCSLNLHSRTDIHGPGAIFSVSGAPGLAMGVGNVGEQLGPYEQGDTFLTRDGGHTWIEIRKGEHLYEFGDHGSIIVLINNEGPTNELLYSWDQGDTWQYSKFSDKPVRVSALTTEPTSTTLKFVIVGHTTASSGEGSQQVYILVDFLPVEMRHCENDASGVDKSDFENWTPKDDDGDSACLLGNQITYIRRRRDRKCIVGNKYENPQLSQQPCECRDIDFECDFGFWRDEDGKCVAHGVHPDRPRDCKDKFTGRSGYKKISKSACEGGIDLSKDKEWECGQGGSVSSSKNEFGDEMVNYIYFNNTDRVIVRTNDQKVYMSENDGSTWTQMFKDTPIVRMLQNPHFEEMAYFITEGRTHHMTTNSGSNFQKFEVPMAPSQSLLAPIMSFHSASSENLIYVGEDGCDGFLSIDCHTEAYYSRNGGQSWDSIGTYVRQCLWGRDGDLKETDQDSIFCEQFHEKSGNQRSTYANPVEFVRSTDYFRSKDTLFDDIVGAAIFNGYLVVASTEHNGANLKFSVSVDGKAFAEAHFPASLDLHREAYTIMESKYNVWLHVSTNTHKNGEYGIIFTSNSNGTYYVMSLENANRNEYGIVDFEKMQGIDGIALANQVTNPNQANVGDGKKLRSMITFDAGGSWNTIAPPETDSNGHKYDCSDCTLNLHSYTERRNPRDLLSLSSAVGLMVGVGNVGKNLSPYLDGDMFLTRDAGKTWKEIYKGAHLWEFADQGALLVLVDDEEATDNLKYTTDEGKTWKSYQFVKDDKKIRVSDIITQPDGTSQKFVIFGKEKGSGKNVGYHVDFSAIHPRQCKLDLEHPTDDDFELWSPEDTRGEKCLFGRETRYYRRIPDSDCFIGARLTQPHEVTRNCACSPADYECNFNHIRNADGKCVLVEGLAPVEPPQCDGNIDYYYEPTAYRKIAASSCQGGQELEKGAQMWCPGKSYSKGIWAVYILLPIGAAAVVFAGLRYHKKRGFGSIRLNDLGDGPTLSNPILAKIVSAAVVIPVALFGLISRIPWPTSIPDFIRNIRLPTFGRSQYSRLSQDEHSGVLLDDYEVSNLDDDADEL